MCTRNADIWFYMILLYYNIHCIINVLLLELNNTISLLIGFHCILEPTCRLHQHYSNPSEILDMISWLVLETVRNFLVKKNTCRHHENEGTVSCPIITEVNADGLFWHNQFRPSCVRGKRVGAVALPSTIGRVLPPAIRVRVTVVARCPCAHDDNIEWGIDGCVRRNHQANP